jgi:hypothetical protein
MTSPYLAHSRPTRKIIEQLILTREMELAKTTAAAERERLERDLAFLRDELARIDDPKRERVIACNPLGTPLGDERARR